MSYDTLPNDTVYGTSRLKAVRTFFTRADAWWLGIDVGAFYTLLALGLPLTTAQLVSLLLASGIAFAVRRRLAVTDAGTVPLPALRAGMVTLAAVFLRGGILVSLVYLLGLPVWLAFLLAAAVACAVNAVGTSLLVIPATVRKTTSEQSWSLLVLGLVVYAFLLKLGYLGLIELLHEEAYYWNYGQHLALSYLDHPPMVGWVTALTTFGFGDTEFAVRLGAFLAWLVGAFYCHALTHRIFGTETARNALLLYAVLPVYFSVSLFVIPDSFLVVCWAGALFYLYRFLVEERASACWGVGLFVGAGMLSKYTIVLLAAAALVFVVTDQDARKWLRRREIYTAIATATLLFLPVVIWNINNNWASFAFQSTRRAEGGFDFDLPDLVGAIAILITPVGLLALPAIFGARGLFFSGQPEAEQVKARRTYRLLMLAIVLPASVFIAFSLFRNTKLNWTGPIWLAALPYFAQLMTPAAERVRTLLPVYGRRPWLITALVLILAYGGFFYYLILGYPGIPYPVNTLGQGWPEISRKVETLVEQIENETGNRPLVVGMDTDRINSWLAFYRGRANPDPETGRTNRGAIDTTAHHLFDKGSNMYEFWLPAEKAVGRDLVLIGQDRDFMDAHWVDLRVTAGGPVGEFTAEHNGWPVRRVYYRVVEDYRGHNLSR